MKLIVQIPCFNEEETLPQTVHDIPSQIPGIDCIEILIVDDGSTDRTVEIAKEIGVHHIIKNTTNMGLARTFQAGLDASLRLGADIIVNTDGDNQYNGADIVKLIQPILNGTAEIVIGDRQTDIIPHFSTIKKKMQKLGSFVVRTLSGTNVPDTVSGFRAFKRSAAIRMNIVSPYSHTIETIIQAGKKRMAITSVPITTNPKTRESRLFKNIPQFVQNQMSTIIRMYTMYKPMRVFFLIGLIMIAIGFVPSVRFTIFYLKGDGAGHIQSLIFAAIMFVVGFQILVIGLIADVLSFNRQLIEEILHRIRKMEYGNSPDHSSPVVSNTESKHQDTAP